MAAALERFRKPDKIRIIKFAGTNQWIWTHANGYYAAGETRIFFFSKKYKILFSSVLLRRWYDSISKLGALQDILKLKDNLSPINLRVLSPSSSHQNCNVLVQIPGHS